MHRIYLMEEGEQTVARLREQKSRRSRFQILLRSGSSPTDCRAREGMVGQGSVSLPSPHT